MKTLLYFLFFFTCTGFLVLSCSSQPQGTIIKGTITGGQDLEIFLDKVSLSKIQVMAKNELQTGGSFKMEFPDGLAPAIYRIRVGTQRVFLIFDGKEKIVEVEAELNKLGEYDFELTGSESGKEMQGYMKKIVARKLSPSELVDLIENTANPIAAMHYSLIGLQPSDASLITMKKVVNRLKSEYPDSEYATEYESQVMEIEKQLARRMAEERIEVGQPAPDIALESPNGSTYRLSDLKGQVVLLDFWASWCGPCRRANPHVVKAYNKYKDQGFTVYSVSLDRPGQKSRWEQAIEQDGLVWPYHVSDLKYWNSAPAAVYGVRGIPRTFLIDREGKIASTRVSPYQLDGEIENIL